MYSRAVSDRLTANSIYRVDIKWAAKFPLKNLSSVLNRRREKQIASVEHYRKTDRPSDL